MLVTEFYPGYKNVTAYTLLYFYVKQLIPLSWTEQVSNFFYFFLILKVYFFNPFVSSCFVFRRLHAGL